MAIAKTGAATRIKETELVPLGHIATIMLSS